MSDLNKLNKQDLQKEFCKKRNEIKHLVGKQYIKHLDLTEPERKALLNFNNTVSISRIEWCIDILDKEKEKLLSKIKRTQVSSSEIIKHNDHVEFDLTQSVEDILNNGLLLGKLVESCLKSSGLNMYELSEEIGKGRKFIGNLLNGDYDNNPVLKKEGVELLKTHLELQQLEENEVMDEKDKQIAELTKEYECLKLQFKDRGDVIHNLQLNVDGLENKVNQHCKKIVTVNEEKTLLSWDVENLTNELTGKDFKIHTLENELKKITDRAIELKTENLDKSELVKALYYKISKMKEVGIAVICFNLICFICALFTYFV